MKQFKNEKILMVIDAWFPLVGGGQIHVQEITKDLAIKGYKVTILTRDLGDWKNEIKGLEVVRVGHFKEFSNPFGRLEFLIISLFWVLTKDFDILHLHAFSPGLLAPFVKLLRPDKRIVFTVHGKGVKVVGFNTSASLLEDLVIYKMPYDVEITVAKNTLTKKTAANKTVVIPNGVDIDKYKRAIRKRNEIKNLLYVGRLSFEKGVDLLIEAFKDLSKKGTVLTIVGTGPEELKLKKLSDNIDSIIFKGRLEGDKLLEEFKKSDLLILPSRTEGLPLVLFEGWASKLPVLATRVGDNEEYIKDGINGFLCDPYEKSIKEGILKIMKAKNLLAKISEEGYKKVKNYSWKNISEETSKVYEQI